jgi:hypothetical protein
MSLFNLKEPTTVDELVGKLLSIDEIRNTSEQQDQEESSMYAQGKKKQFRQYKSLANEDRADEIEVEKKFKCYKYHEPCHKASKCPEKGSKLGTGKQKGKCKKRAIAMMSVAAQ